MKPNTIAKKALKGSFYPTIIQGNTEGFVFGNDNSLSVNGPMGFFKAPNFKGDNPQPIDKRGILASITLMLSRKVIDRSTDAVSMARLFSPMINEAALTLFKLLGTPGLNTADYKIVVENPDKPGQFLIERSDLNGYEFKVYAVRN